MKMIKMMPYGSGLAMKIRRTQYNNKEKELRNTKERDEYNVRNDGRVVETAKGTMITIATYDTLHTHVCVCTSLRIPATWQ